MNRSRTAAAPTPERQIHYAWIVAGGAGTLRTMLGTYEQAFLIAGALCVLAALLALRIGMRTKRQGHMAAATA